MNRKLVGFGLMAVSFVSLPSAALAVGPRNGAAPKTEPPSAHAVALDKAARLGGTKMTWAAGAQGKLLGLEIRGAQANDQTLAVIGQLHDLKLLSLAPTQPSRVTDQGLQQLANLTELEYLGLTSTGVTDAGLEVLRQMPHLKRLELPAGATDAAIEIVTQLPELEQLRVWPAKLSNSSMPAVAKLRCLRFLDLSGTKIDGAGVAHLRELECLSQLDLRGTQVDATVLAQLLPKIDDDLMYVRGPYLLRKLYLNTDLVLDSRQVDDLIRLLGMCEIDASRPRAEPGKTPRSSETIVPELTATWLDRARLEAYREEVSYWKTLGAYVEFGESLEPGEAVPAQLLEGPMTTAKLERLTQTFREQAWGRIVGLYFVRPRSKDERPRDDSIFPAGLSSRTLPPQLQRLSFRDTEITVSTFVSVIAPAIRAGVPIKTINVFNTATRETESLSKAGLPPFLGAPSKPGLTHMPFTPGQPELEVPGTPSRVTLAPEDLKNLEEALSKIDRLIMTEEQAERLRTAVPGLADKIKTRPRYLPGEEPLCIQNADGTLRSPFCGPESKQ